VPIRHAVGAEVVISMTLVSLFWSTACSARDKCMQYNHISTFYRTTPGAADASGAVDRTCRQPYMLRMYAIKGFDNDRRMGTNGRLYMGFDHV
jgi:hypothetical protein